MQAYLGLKLKSKPASVPRLATPAAEQTVDRAIDLLHEEFFSTGTKLKHVFTSAQVL